MKIAAMTMVYNESKNLPLWQRYYGSLFGEDSIYVFDHGSDDGSTDGLRNVSRIPREVFDDNQRVRFLNHMRSALSTYYDIVLYTDCDEFLVAEPNKYESLVDYIQRFPHDYSTAIGLNVTHEIDEEPALDWSRGILGQRSYVLFVSSMCKTLVSRKPIIWGGGFHGSNCFPNFDGDLFLFHLKRADLKSNLSRQQTTRQIPWKDQAQGAHQRTSDDEVAKAFRGWASLKKTENESFDFSPEVTKFKNLTVARGNGLYQPSAFFGSQYLVRIPERFKAIF